MKKIKYIISLTLIFLLSGAKAGLPGENVNIVFLSEHDDDKVIIDGLIKEISHVIGLNDVNIEVTLTRAKDPYYGNILRASTYPLGENNFEIELYTYYKYEIDWPVFARTLAHELIHVYQFSSGKMKYVENDPYVVWGTDTVYWQTPYRERPWELEAFKLSDIVIQEVKKRFKRELLYEESIPLQEGVSGQGGGV